MIHLLQNYKRNGPFWLVEGIADYYRWVLYEKKKITFFPITYSRDGYYKGYEYAAGFLFWLEMNTSSGIVNKLHREMTKGTYQDSFFEDIYGKDLEELWVEYINTQITKTDK